MIKSERLNKKLVFILSVILCVLISVIFTSTYAQAETYKVEGNVLTVSYNGSSNSVSCGIYITAQAIDTIQAPIYTRGEISVSLKKIEQDISFPIGIKLTGSVALNYAATNEKLKEVPIEKTFDSTTKDYSKLLFNDNDFSKGSGLYTISVNLTFKQSFWSTSHNETVTINHSVN